MTHYSDNLPYAFCEQIGKEIRDISDEIPFEIPDSWEWVRLSYIGEIVGGGTPKTGETSYWENGDIPWLTPADMKYVKGKYVSSGERFITEKGLNESSAQLMPMGTVLYSSRAPIGYIAIAENNICTNQGFKSLVPFLKEINLYAYYCLIAFTPDIQSRASGTTFKEISGAEFGRTIIPLPPLSEQHRIVAKIEELLPYIEKYGKAEEHLTTLNKTFPEALKKSILQEAVQGKLVPQNPDDEPANVLLERIRAEKQALIKAGKIKKDKHESVIVTRDKIPYEIIDGKERCIADEVPFELPDSWCWCRLGDILLKLTDGTHSTPKYTEIGVPFISVKDVSAGKLDFSNCKHIREVEKMRDNLVNLVTTGAVDIESSDDKFKALNSEEKYLRDQIEQLKLKAQTKTDLRLMLKTISDELKNYDDSIVKYNETAVRKVVECVKVISKTEVELTFKGGFDMMVEVEK